MPPDKPTDTEQASPETMVPADGPDTGTASAARQAQWARLSRQMILDSFAPAAVLTNQDFEVLHCSGPTENYLELPLSAPPRDLPGAAREGLGSRLRGALEQAVASRAPVLVCDARVKRRNSFLPVRFSILPAADSGDGQTLFLVVFEDVVLAEDKVELRVRKRTAQLRTLIAELTLTGERERRTLARDLHDDLGQVLAIVKIKLTSLEGCERRGSLKTSLKEIEALVDQANRSVRSMMQQLSPPILQALGLVAALEWLAEEMERLYGLAVRIDCDDELPDIDEPVRTTIFRAIQELLINVAKHADTNTAQILCHLTDDGRFSVSVIDQGEGFDYHAAQTKPAKDSGFGLISVAERIEFIGGKMTVDTMLGYGTTISIAFPVKNGSELSEKE
jgi:signal transduction histidine kinase